MDCPECADSLVTFAVPPDLREHVPGGEPAAGLCPVCLTLRPADSPPDPPDFARFGPAFPTGEPGVAMALGVGLLDELALHRPAITALFDRVERAGTDPLLVLDRLAGDQAIDPPFDVRRRRDQLEQLR